LPSPDEEAEMVLKGRSIVPGRYVRRVRACSVILMCLALSVCTYFPTKPTMDIGDGGFLSGEPCGPPCLWGIVPGETTEAEVVEILEQRGIYAACETRVSKFVEGSKGIDCGSRVFISFEQGDDRVQGVYFKPSSSITVQEVIAKYGAPDGVLVYPESVPEHPRISVYLIYSSMLSRLELPTQEWPGYIVEPSTPILSVFYTAQPSDIRDSLFLKRWIGYGEY
jgi:hypothetical protein